MRASVLQRLPIAALVITQERGAFHAKGRVPKFRGKASAASRGQPNLEGRLGPRWPHDALDGVPRKMGLLRHVDALVSYKGVCLGGRAVACER